MLLEARLWNVLVLLVASEDTTLAPCLLECLFVLNFEPTTVKALVLTDTNENNIRAVRIQQRLLVAVILSCQFYSQFRGLFPGSKKEQCDRIFGESEDVARENYTHSWCELTDIVSKDCS